MARDVAFDAARGEVADFQIALRASGTVAGVDAGVGDLVADSGARIAATSITAYREHAVPVSPGSTDWGGTVHPLGAGRYFDPLIPFDDDAGHDLAGAIDARPFALGAGTTQALWFDIAVPDDAAPGVYRGAWWARAGGWSTGGVVTLRVRGEADFEYVALLDGLGHGDDARAIAAGVGADWRAWTRDGAALLAARARLADAIEAAMAGASTTGGTSTGGTTSGGGASATGGSTSADAGGASRGARHGCGAGAALAAAAVAAALLLRPGRR